MLLDIACNLIAEFIALQIAKGYSGTIHSEIFLQCCKRLGHTPTENDFSHRYTQACSDYWAEGKSKEFLVFFKDRNTVSAFHALWYKKLSIDDFAEEIKRLHEHFINKIPDIRDFVGLEEAMQFYAFYEDAVSNSQSAGDRLLLLELQEEFAKLQRKIDGLSKIKKPVKGRNTGPIYLSPTRQPPLAAHLVLGRQKDLDAIAEHLAKGDHLLLLNGMGGVGKSTLAGCYMERSASGYRHIAWVNYTGNFAADCVREVNDYRTLAFEPEGNTEAQFEQLLRAMERLPAPNLLVVDNLNTLAHVADAATCARHLPNGWKVLLTAREHDDRFPRHDVGVLALPDARELFLRNRPLKPAEHTEDLDQLLELVGRHTLVVELLAKTTAGQGWTLAKMRQRLLAEGLTRLDTKVEVGTTHSNHQRQRMAAYVSALFDINLAQLSEEERWLLAQLSMLPAWVHPCSLLEEMFFFQIKKLPERIPVFARFKRLFFPKEKKVEHQSRLNKDALHSLLYGLTKKGFLEKQISHYPTYTLLEAEAPEEDGFYMHPILKEVVREKEQPGYERCKEMVEFFIDKYDLTDGSRNPVLAFPWLPYSDILAARLPDHERTAVLANNLSWVYLEKGDLDAALEWQLKANSIFEKVLGKNHPHLANLYNNLSAIHQAKSDLAPALEWQLKAIAIFKKALKENHPHLASAYNNLSEIYRAQGDLGAALEWQLKAIAIRGNALKENHPNLATSYCNLSEIYRAQGDLDAALEWQLKAIAIRKKGLEENHPALAESFNNLSAIHHDKGDLDAALEWQLKSIAIKEKALGESHPSLAASYNNLSLIHHDKGHLAMALEWQLKAIVITEKVLGEYHPDLAKSLVNLAIIYDEMNEPRLALPLLQWAVDFFQQRFPQEHPQLDVALWWLECIERKIAGQEK